MNTLLLHPEDAGAIEQAGAMLASGQVVGIPTETVYGLGANALDGTLCARSSPPRVVRWTTR